MNFSGLDIVNRTFPSRIIPEIKSGNVMRAIAWVLFITTAFCLATAPSFGRQAMISHQEYLNAAGVEAESEELKRFLLSGLKEELPGMTEHWYQENAGFFTFILLINGVTPEIAFNLQNEGIDVIHAVSSEARPLGEQSLLADLVIAGEVMRITENKDIDDGFDVSVEVRITELLKGEAPGDTIVIRQSERRRLAETNPDNRPEEGRTYLFLLSGGMYGYQLVNHDLRTKGEALVSLYQVNQERKFVIYRIYPFSGDRLLWLDYNRQQTEQAFEQIRFIDQLLKR